jgi:hypothetical protein
MPKVEKRVIIHCKTAKKIKSDERGKVAKSTVNNPCLPTGKPAQPISGGFELCVW